MTHVPIQTLVADDELQIRWLPGATDALILVFTGIKHAVAGIPMDEFVGTASSGGKRHVLFISDMHRSWFSRPGLVERICQTVDKVRVENSITDTTSVGNSMGGYGAMLLAAPLETRSVLAISPQVSMHPDVIDERRWLEYQKTFGPDLRLNAAADYVGSDRQLTVLAGRGCGPDIRQIELLPEASTIHLHILNGGDHDLVRELKDQRLLSPILEASISADQRGLRTSLDAYQPTSKRLLAKAGRRLRQMIRTNRVSS